MYCPNCGASEPGPGAFCMRCGARLPVAAPAESAVVAALPPAAPPAPVQWSGPAPYRGERTVRHVSAGSVFKVTFVTYLFLLGLAGFVFFVLPGLLGSSLLGGVLREMGDYGYALGALSGGIVATLLVYVLGVVGISFVEGVLMAIVALIYNLIAGWVGGVRVELRD